MKETRLKLWHSSRESDKEEIEPKKIGNFALNLNMSSFTL